jgi:tRNA A37 threonylcarbamoyladenosine synthetase subunit TsaC/SUA5/YrdC
VKQNLVMQQNTIELIAKEKINSLTFSRNMQSTDNNLVQKLQNAEKLGNSFKGKVTIIFETTEGTKKTETTIWNTTSDYIQLKGETMIPISSVVDILF